MSFRKSLQDLGRGGNRSRLPPLLRKIILIGSVRFACLAIFFSTTVYAVQVPSEEYAKAIAPLWAKMSRDQSEHFEIWTEAQDKILRPYALAALEDAYARIGAVLKTFPQQKIRVEIYRTKEGFSLASTLSIETLDRSGAIGICKFERLMILTPEQLAFGYRWLDTLAHEYTHYLINILSRGNCPLWLHEGTAKYLETLWRLDNPDYLTAGNRTELARAAQEDRLIPFEKMAPSMVFLKDQNEVHLAFSQVAHALHFVETREGSDGIRKMLENSAGLNAEIFEISWKEFLKKEDLKETPGALQDKIKIGSGNEVNDLTSVNIRGHIRLGDRLRQAEKPEASLLQYRKALEKEPANPVALTHLARALITLGKETEALAYLETAVKDNPNYEPSFVLLGEIYFKKGDFKKSEKMFHEANALNPFDPQVQKGLKLVQEKSGD